MDEESAEEDRLFLRLDSSPLWGVLLTVLAGSLCQATAGQAPLHESLRGDKWHEVLLAAVRGFSTACPFPTAIARQLFVVQAAVYDAWARYDSKALGVYSKRGTARLHTNDEKTDADNKNEAISFAAYHALTYLFPPAEPKFLELLEYLGYDGSKTGSSDSNTAAGAGNLAAFNVIENRKNDSSNQDNNYAEPMESEYKPFCTADDLKAKKCNTALQLLNASAWQPQCQLDMPPQKPLTPHWRNVLPFALEAANQFLPPRDKTFLANDSSCPNCGYNEQAGVILAYSTTLDDREKVIADYWHDFQGRIEDNGTIIQGSNEPPGHWTQYAEWFLLKKNSTLDQEVQLLLALTAGLLDASISAWDTKYQYNSARPVTAIRYAFDGQLVLAHERDNNDESPVLMRASAWEPFQPKGATPPFPSFVSGHSTFGGAFEAVMHFFFGSDEFGLNVTIAAKSLPSEMSSPLQDTTLYYPTFSYASIENGISRLYNGVHYVNDNVCGRASGLGAGIQAFKRMEALRGGKTDFDREYAEQVFNRVCPVGAIGLRDVHDVKATHEAMRDFKLLLA
ncbi:hypothetical protein WJX81_003818 [Elliptochloris bilobata]|uniref:Phosphatidic acid phosphatase type 2/haloperoxidase domain-containing protein n=1 Tax=Elliptochloris bilobata TaxID=381761 RepID=A0AAW1SJV7_9CHLO